MPELKNNLFAPVFNQGVKYLEEGISVIPVRDKDEIVNGESKPKKSPYSSWKKYQTEFVTKEELYFELEKFDTTAIATITGKISGNLEAVDIDVKWKPGIGNVVMDAIAEVAPELRKKLRIHQTPTFGYHILYRISDHEVPRGRKLASRLATKEELQKDKAKERCFIETRAEGQYVVSPPSIGYSVFQDNPIPQITWEERNTIINICLSFSEVSKEDKKPKEARADFDYYSLNPFEHFNQSPAGENVLVDNGWTRYGENSNHLYFTRPGSQSNGLHATYMKKSRLFRIFTTNSEIDPDTNYTPSTIKALLEFNGDKKKLRVALVNAGYGQIKPERERGIVSSAALNGRPVPANISTTAKEAYAQLVSQKTEIYPHGVFWEVDDGTVRISRSGIQQVAEGLGFCLYQEGLRQIDGRFLHERKPRVLWDALLSYIQDKDGDTYAYIVDAFEGFVQKNGNFAITRFREIPDDQIFKDSTSEGYKYFENGYLRITAAAIEFFEYGTITDKLILAERKQSRNYLTGVPGGKYLEFLDLALNYRKRKEYIDSIIGFLAHEQKDTSTAFIIVLVEEVPDPKQGGGSGKNIFTSLFALTTTIHSVAGAQVNLNEKFLQTWNGQRIFAVSDVRKKFDFSFLKNLSSDSGILKKLFKDQATVPIERMPKFIVSTNHSYEVSDGGLKRRIIPLEFTDYFTKKGGVDVYFGCFFPDGWDDKDWAGFDSIIANGIQAWLKSGRKLKPIDLSEDGWTKQFDQAHWPETRKFIKEYWPKWVDLSKPTNLRGGYFVTNDEFKSDYKRFCEENNIHFEKGPEAMNDALQDWSEHLGFKFDREGKKHMGADVYIRGKLFLLPDAPF